MSKVPDIEHRCDCGNGFMRPHTVMMRHGYGSRVWCCNNCDGLWWVTDAEDKAEWDRVRRLGIEYGYYEDTGGVA